MNAIFDLFDNSFNDSYEIKIIRSIIGVLGELG